MARALVAAWLLGALMILAALVIERFRLATVARRASVCDSGPLAASFAHLCHEAGVAGAPRLLIGAADAMPMTWGSLWPVVLLPAGAPQWSGRRIEAVIRHELAHVRRRDDLVQLAATVMTALHWFDPLAWLALRRLRIEREHACDDAVLRRGERPSAYAAELLHIAGAFRTPAGTGLAVQSMARPSQLRRRLLAVLEESRDRRALTRRRVAFAALLAAALALPVAALAFTITPVPAEDGALPPSSSAGTGATAEPAFDTVLGNGPVGTGPIPAAVAPQVSECWAPDVERNARSMSNSDDRQRTLQWESDNCTADLRLRGELSFNDDFTAVTGISADGSFLLVHREGGVERRLEILPGAGGTVQRNWRIDGRELSFDADAERWFAGILVQILRASGIAAQERTVAIYRAQGVEGVFREVGLIPGNSARGLYLVALVEQAELADGELARLLGIAADGIDSNSTRARVLEAVGERYPERIVGGGVDDAYWQAVAGIDSNSTTARLLESLVEGAPQSDPMVARVLEQAAVLIDSNSTLASLLRRLHQQYPEILTRQPEATLFWRTAVSIDSNSTINSFLLDISNGAPVDSSLLPLILDTAQTRISSSSTLADFVLAIERRYPGIGVSGPLTEEFWATVQQVDSSSTLLSLLLNLSSGKSEDSAMLDRVLDAADRIDSSSQRGRFLLEFARMHEDAARGRLRDRILEMTNEIGSRSARERTLRDLAELGIG